MILLGVWWAKITINKPYCQGFTLDSESEVIQKWLGTCWKTTIYISYPKIYIGIQNKVIICWNYHCHLGVNCEKKRTLTKKDSWGLWMSIFKDRALNPFLHRLLCKLHFVEKPVQNCLPLNWTAGLCTRCFCHLSQAFWRFPGILSQWVWLRLSSFNGRCSRPTGQRETLFRPIRPMFGTIKLWGLRAIICMRWTNEEQKMGTSVPVSQLPSGSRVHCPFPPKTEDCVRPWQSWNTQAVSPE